MAKLVTSSVVRGAQQGQSHGGVYLIDLENQTVEQTIDWNTSGIDWQGRGWDRGLRGIAFDGEQVFIAASDELFAYTPDFELIDSKESKIIEAIIRASNENFCLTPFLRKADRIAIEKSSRLVTMTYHQLVFR